MPLAELHAVAPDRQTPPPCPVVIDQMQIQPESRIGLKRIVAGADFPQRMSGLRVQRGRMADSLAFSADAPQTAAVIVLDEHGMRLQSAAAVLQMEIAEVRSAQDKAAFSRLRVEHPHPVFGPFRFRSGTQGGGDGDAPSVRRDGGKRIKRRRRSDSVLFRQTGQFGTLPRGRIQFPQPQTASVFQFINEVVKAFSVRGKRRSGDTAFIGKRSQISVFLQIAEQVAVARVPRIAPVRMGGLVKHEPPRIRRKDLRLHINVAGRNHRIVRQLVKSKTIRNLFSCKLPETLHSAPSSVIRTVRKLLGL